MLIGTHVKTKWSTNNKLYYEKLGYIFTKYKDTISVKIEDLSRCSKVRVTVKCDNPLCGKISTIAFAMYNWRKNTDEIDLCKSCRLKKDKYTKIEDVKAAFLSLGLTPLVEEYIDYKEKLPCICIKHPNVIQFKNYNNVKRGAGCKLCANEAKIGALNPAWCGGKTSIIEVLNKNIKGWKKAVAINSKCICELTGIAANTNKCVVHHREPASVLLQMVLSNFDLSKYDNYTSAPADILDEIKNKYLQEHNNVVGHFILETVHILFHRMYGYKNFNGANFEEFTSDFKKGWVVFK